MSLRRTAVISQAICFACFQGVPLSWLPCLLLLTALSQSALGTGMWSFLCLMSRVTTTECLPASHLFCSLLGCKLIAYVASAIAGKTGRLQTVGQRFLLAVPDEATLLERHRLIFFILIIIYR